MRSLLQYWKGTGAYMLVRRMLKQGKPILVSQGEAEHRALVCRSCPKNIGKDHDAADKLMAAMVDNRKVPDAEKLGICSICSCQINTIVHVVPEIIMHGNNTSYLKQHPAHCWKQKFKL